MENIKKEDPCQPIYQKMHITNWPFGQNKCLFRDNQCGNACLQITSSLVTTCIRYFKCRTTHLINLNKKGGIKKKLVLVGAVILTLIANGAMAQDTLRLLTWKGHAPAKLVKDFEAPGYQLHYYTPEKNLVSHTIYVRDIDGPYLFEEYPSMQQE